MNGNFVSSRFFPCLEFAAGEFQNVIVSRHMLGLDGEMDLNILSFVC